MRSSLSWARFAASAAAAVLVSGGFLVGTAVAQPGHDAFDKTFGYDSGREEQAAHNYLLQTGQEDVYGDSQGGQVGANQYQNGQQSQRYNAAQQNGRQFRQQNRTSQNRNTTNSSADRNRAYSSDQTPTDQQMAQQPGHNLGVSWGMANGRLTAQHVSQNGQLAQEGLEQGDQIVSVGGQRVRTEADFNRAISAAQPGFEVPIVVSRGGKRDSIYWAAQGQQVGYNQQPSAQYQNRPSQQADWNVPARTGQRHAGQGEFTMAARLTEGPRGNAFLGVQLDRNRNDERVVTRVYPDSPAQQAGLQAGDVLVAVNGQRIQSPSDLTQHITQLQAGHRVQLTVERLGQQMPARMQPNPQRPQQNAEHQNRQARGTGPVANERAPDTLED